MCQPLTGTSEGGYGSVPPPSTSAGGNATYHTPLLCSGCVHVRRRSLPSLPAKPTQTPPRQEALPDCLVQGALSGLWASTALFLSPAMVLACPECRRLLRVASPCGVRPGAGSLQGCLGTEACICALFSHSKMPREVVQTIFGRICACVCGLPNVFQA